MSELLYRIVHNNIADYNDNHTAFVNLCYNPNFPVKLLDDYPNGLCGYKWPIEAFSSNSAITPDFIESHIEGINGEKWNVTSLSKNKSLTTEFIEDHLDWEWNMEYLSQNPCVTINFMRNHPKGINNRKWDNETALRNINLSLDEYFSFFKLEHDPSILNYICDTKMVTLEFIEHILNSKYKDLLNIGILSYNSVITEEFVEKHPDLEWELEGLCVNSSISTKFACNYIWKSNDRFYTYFDKLLINVNADYEFLLKYNTNDKMINYFTNLFNVHKMFFIKMYSRFEALGEAAFNPKGNGIWEDSNTCMKFPIDAFLTVAPITIIEKNIYLIREIFDILALERNTELTLEFVEKHIEGFNGIMWTDDVFSRYCPLEYIAENPKGYYCKNNGKTIPWDIEIISHRSYKATNVHVKSARKL